MKIPQLRPPGSALRLAVLALGSFLMTASAPAPGQEPAKEKDIGRAARLDEMTRLIGDFRVVEIDGDARTPLGLRPGPLLRWNDPTRDFSDGALWAWGANGRPAALVSAELYPDEKDTETWCFEFASLSTRPRVEAEGGEGFTPDWAYLTPPRPDGQIRWEPRTPGITFRAIPDAPAPARDEAGRLRQMKDLTRRFAAREEFFTAQSKSIALRLLPRPIDRYADPAAGLVDGALFAFANGTNPEVVLLIEAQGRPPDSAAWRFAAARLSLSGVALTLDGAEAWSVDHPDRIRPDATYCIFRKYRTPSTKP